MIFGIIGDCGCGKTLLMTMMLHGKSQKKSAIFANYGLTFPFTKLTDDFFKDYSALPIFDCAVGMDEISVYYSSRGAMCKRNKHMSKFIVQTRKRNVNLYYTAQQASLVDVRIRNNTDYYIYPKMFIRDKKGKILNKSPTYRYKEDSGHELFIIVETVKKADGPAKAVRRVLRHVERQIEMYDTYQIIDFTEED